MLAVFVLGVNTNVKRVNLLLKRKQELNLSTTARKLLEKGLTVKDVVTYNEDLNPSTFDCLCKLDDAVVFSGGRWIFSRLLAGSHHVSPGARVNSTLEPACPQLVSHVTSRISSFLCSFTAIQILWCLNIYKSMIHLSQVSRMGMTGVLHETSHLVINCTD